jgi:hypothetical protein
MTHGGLPDTDEWPEQFKAVVGEAHTLRGVEVTVRASVTEEDDELVVQSPGLRQRVTLVPLRNKIEWDFERGSVRAPAAGEVDAFRQLAARRGDARAGSAPVEVTGPLRKAAGGFTLEVRRLNTVTPPAD